ncbi:MAG: methyltransferase domain-containing protein [Bacteroidota bacterium]
MRYLTSYYKVQKFISIFKRRYERLIPYKGSKKYLDLGCGNNISKDFINVDYIWMPGVDICMDIAKHNLPLKSNSIEGIFSEHCIEHLPYDEMDRIFKEFHRILKRGSLVRIIVPDGEIYLNAYVKKVNGGINEIPYYENSRTAMERINGIFRNHGHLFIYDFETLKLLLEEAGFKQIEKRLYLEGRNPFLLKDSEWRKVESLYVEAEK